MCAHWNMTTVTVTCNRHCRINAQRTKWTCRDVQINRCCFGGNRIFWSQRQTKLRITGVCSLARVGSRPAMSQPLSHQRLQDKGDKSRCRNRGRCLHRYHLYACGMQFLGTIHASIRNNIGLKLPFCKFVLTTNIALMYSTRF